MRQPCSSRDKDRTRVRQSTGRPARPAQPGQTLVVFALLSIIFLAALGLVLDSGYSLVQRRTLQNAADAAALKGAQDVQLNVAWLRGAVGGLLFGNGAPTVYADMRTIAMQNGLPDPNDPNSGTTLRCEFVGNPVLGLDLTTVLPVLGDCNGSTGLLPISLPVPTLATGVRVTVTKRHRTLVMHLLGTPTATVSATATAQLHLPSIAAITADTGPFIVCGVNTRLPSQLPGLGSLGLNTGLSVLLTDPLTGRATNPPQINPLAIGQTFVIQGSNVATCGLRSNSGFTGLNDLGGNEGQIIPDGGTTIGYKVAGRPDPTQVAVPGVNGCVAGQMNDCVMILPIADALPVTNNCLCIHAITYGAFWITQVDAGTYTGKLIWPYSIQAQGTLTWTPSQIPGVLIIRLTQ